jgi:three-Cys-motif partner protein
MKSDALRWLDDGLPMLESGVWTEQKYLTLFNYLEIFSTGMKKTWGRRIYVDLYSGPGCTRVEGTARVLKGSPLLALSVKTLFDKYLFCEVIPRSLEALEQRVTKVGRSAEVRYIAGDCNESVDDIIREIPESSRSSTVLTFCFVDPFDLSIQLKTLRKLAGARRIDFLVLLALFMDANRNEKHYTSLENRKVDLFLDSSGWRDEWSEYKTRDDSFPRFLARQFEKRMIEVGYLKSGQNTKEFRSSEKNLPLYHLAFFSRSQRGYDFWKKGTSYSTPQLSLDF